MIMTVVPLQKKVHWPVGMVRKRKICAGDARWTWPKKRHASPMQPGDDDFLSIGAGTHNDRMFTIFAAWRIHTEKSLSTHAHARPLQSLTASTNRHSQPTRQSPREDGRVPLLRSPLPRNQLLTEPSAARGFFHSCFDCARLLLSLRRKSCTRLRRRRKLQERLRACRGTRPKCHERNLSSSWVLSRICTREAIVRWHIARSDLSALTLPRPTTSWLAVNVTNSACCFCRSSLVLTKLARRRHHNQSFSSALHNNPWRPRRLHRSV